MERRHPHTSHPRRVDCLHHSAQTRHRRVARRPAPHQRAPRNQPARAPPPLTPSRSRGFKPRALAADRPHGLDARPPPAPPSPPCLATGSSPLSTPATSPSDPHSRPFPPFQLDCRALGALAAAALTTSPPGTFAFLGRPHWSHAPPPAPHPRPTSTIHGLRVYHWRNAPRHAPRHRLPPTTSYYLATGPHSTMPSPPALPPSVHPDIGPRPTSPSSQGPRDD